MEVVMAAGLFAVGATGVLAMQRSAISGNSRAHRIDVATSIASAWVDRMRADAALWTSPDTKDTTKNYKSRPLLKDIVASGAAPWITPARTTVRGENASFDINGLELPAGVGGAADTELCVQYRQTWVTPDRMMRVDVRVYWANGTTQAQTPIADANGVCNSYTEPAAGSSHRDYSSIMTSSLIRGNF